MNSPPLGESLVQVLRETSADHWREIWLLSAKRYYVKSMSCLIVKRNTAVDVVM
jgi:hypothetical protein